MQFADGASIVSVSTNVITDPGEEAVLSCTVEGKPIGEEYVRWERLGYDMATKTSTKFENKTSFLHIKNAQRDDVGNFRCVADNRVANPTSRDVLLVVKCKLHIIYIYIYIYSYMSFVLRTISIFFYPWAPVSSARSFTRWTQLPTRHHQQPHSSIAYTRSNAFFFVVVKVVFAHTYGREVCRLA